MILYKIEMYYFVEMVQNSSYKIKWYVNELVAMSNKRQNNWYFANLYGIWYRIRMWGKSAYLSV